MRKFLERYSVRCGTWDTFIDRHFYLVGQEFGSVFDSFPTWDAAKDFAVSDLTNTLRLRLYSEEVANPDAPFVTHPSMDQIEAEQRDYIEQLLDDIRNPKIGAITLSDGSNTTRYVFRG